MFACMSGSDDAAKLIGGVGTGVEAVRSVLFCSIFIYS